MCIRVSPTPGCVPPQSGDHLQLPPAVADPYLLSRRLPAMQDSRRPCYHHSRPAHLFQDGCESVQHNPPLHQLTISTPNGIKGRPGPSHVNLIVHQLKFLYQMYIFHIPILLACHHCQQGLTHIWQTCCVQVPCSYNVHQGITYPWLRASSVR
jgi:hypothetical protein